MNIQDWFPLGLIGLTSFQSKGLSRVFSKTTVQKYQFFNIQPFLWSNSQSYITNRKTIALARQNFVSKVMTLLFNMVSRFIITFLPRSKHLSISWMQSPSAVILEPKKIKFLTVSIVSPFICHEVMGTNAIIFIFWMLSFKPTFSLSSFTLIKKLFSSFSFSAIKVVSSSYMSLLRLCIYIYPYHISLSIHLSMNNVLTVVNNAATNRGYRYLFETVISFSFC